MPHSPILSSPWLLVGFAGQIFFFGRFLVQWYQSERQQRSVIPIAFWYMSLGGGLLLLAYSIHIGDPVFIAGQLAGSIVYVRNLMFIHRKRGSPDALERL